MEKFTHKKSLGQNFLKNDTIIKKIIDIANITSDDVILEIGPGEGVLTQDLAKHAKRVISIELDDRLIPILQDRFHSHKNVEIIHGDILHMDVNTIIANHKLSTINYKIVANIPYYITAPIIRLFLECDNRPQELVLMVQKEVAERLSAKKGHMSVLGICVQYYADVSYEFTVPRIEFDPVPKVDSAIIKLKINNKNIQNENERNQFFRTVKIGFSAKRKTLSNNISNGFHKTKDFVELLLIQNGFTKNVRAQELGVDDWKNIARDLHK